MARHRKAYPNLSKFLEDLTRQGRTQGDFAAEIGISEGHLSDIKTGRRRPGFALAKVIADTANIPLESFLDEVAS